MRLAPKKHADQPAYPARNRRRRFGPRLARWCGMAVATGAAALSLTLLSAYTPTDQVRIAGGWAPGEMESFLYDSVPPPERKPPQRAPAHYRDPSKPPPPGGPGHRHLPPPRRTRT